MELRPGYKQTEVGVIPDEWVVDSLGNRASFRTGPFGSALHQSDYISDGLPVVNPMHIVDGKLLPSAGMTISENTARRLSEFRIKVGEVVIGRRGDMGRCAVVRSEHSGWLCGTGSMIIRPNNTEPDFLQRILSSPEVIESIEGTSVGTTMINLNQGTLAGLKLQFPPLEEQRAIATALSDVDALIAGLEKLIAKKRDLKQAAMQQLLTGQTRLPGFSGAWEVKTLGSVLQFQVGFPFGSEHFNDKSQGLRLVKNRDLKADDQIVYYSGRYESSYLVNDGDVLIGMDGDFMPCKWKQGQALLNQRVGRLRALAGIDLIFAYYFLMAPLKDIEAETSATTVKHLSHGDIEGIVGALPPVAEQTAIATVLSDMDVELAALESRLAKTRAIKQGMMQELLTGRTRLV